MNPWRRLLAAMLAAAWVMAISPFSLGQDKEKGQEEEEVKTIYQKTTIIDFSDVTITGELTKPEGSYLMNKKRANFKVLIRVRDNFLPEMIKSVDNL